MNKKKLLEENKKMRIAIVRFLEHSNEKCGCPCNKCCNALWQSMLRKPERIVSFE